MASVQSPACDVIPPWRGGRIYHQPTINCSLSQSGPVYLHVFNQTSTRLHIPGKRSSVDKRVHRDYHLAVGPAPKKDLKLYSRVGVPQIISYQHHMLAGRPCGLFHSPASWRMPRSQSCDLRGQIVLGGGALTGRKRSVGTSGDQKLCFLSAAWSVCIMWVTDSLSAFTWWYNSNLALVGLCYLLGDLLLS